MNRQNHLPASLFDTDMLISRVETDSYYDIDELLKALPETVLISLVDQRPENDIAVQQNTLTRLKEGLEKEGIRTSIIYCRSICFNQNKLDQVKSIRTLVFLGVKPYNVEVLVSKFYTKIKWENKNIIVAHTVYKMDNEKIIPPAVSVKRKLWDALLLP